MPTFDEESTAHLDSGEPTKPIFLIFMDFMDEPIRATTLLHPITLPPSDDPDLSEQTFYPTIGVLKVGTVRFSDNGSETLTVEMSGRQILDAELLGAAEDRANWQGRSGRLWVIIRDEDRRQRGGIGSYYSGYASSLSIDLRPDSQVIRVDLEGYKALLTRASNRSYLDQARYDGNDTSAAASIGATNDRDSGPSALGGGGDPSGRHIELRRPMTIP